MNTRIQTDAWISRIVIVLGVILVASVVGVLVWITAGQPMPEILVALGFVATGGLLRVLASPLTSRLME